MHTPLQLDLDVDAGREIETHQGIHRVGGGLQDVDQALMGAHLKLLARILVYVRALDDAVNRLRSVGSGMGPDTLAPVF